MQELILTFDGSTRDFQNAMCSPDEQFDLLDTIFYAMDYEDEGVTSYHNTPYGAISVKYTGGK